MQKLSVIVPVYNTEKYLDKCLDSLVNQTFEDIEILIINDGTKDNSEEIIENYIKRYPNKIKYFKKENGGLSDTKNYGVERALGEYITFVDSDDYVDKDLYIQLRSCMENQIDLIKYKLIRVDEEYAEIGRGEGPVFGKSTGERAFQILFPNDTMIEPSWLYLYRKEFFVKNKFKFSVGLYHEDFGLTPLCIVCAESVISTAVYGYYYLLRENSITTNLDYEKKKERSYDLLKHYDNMIDKIENCEVKDDTKKNIKQYYTNTILLQIEELLDIDKKNFIQEIKQRKMIHNIQIKNVKQLIKRILLIINIELYIKINKRYKG